MRKSFFKSVYDNVFNVVRYLSYEGHSIEGDFPHPIWFLVVGLIYGLIFSGVYAITWKCFGDVYFTERTRLRLIPAMGVIIVASILNYNQLCSIGITIKEMVKKNTSEDDSLGGILLVFVVILLVILLKYSIFLAMPYHSLRCPSDWRRFFNFMYPRMNFRVLILMGLWGKMGILISSATGYRSSALPEVERRLREKTTVKSLLILLFWVVLITGIYLSSWQSRALGVVIAVIVFLLTYIYSMVVSWYLKGHTRFSMLSAGEVAEVVLLLCYLASAKYW